MGRQKTENLQSLIQAKVFRATLLPLVLLELLFLLLYFGIIFFISEKNQDVLISEVSRVLPAIIEREAETIDVQLQELARLTEVLQLEHEQFFDLFYNNRSADLVQQEPKLAVHPNGSLYKVEDNGGGALWYSALTTVGKKEYQKARDSEILDPLLKKIVESNPVVAQAYINTRDNMSRLYPFVENFPDQIGGKLDVTKFNFYQMADARHNPSRGATWTNAYLDPVGQGWVISSVVPVYYNEVLEAVSGLDITVDIFVRKILELNLPWQTQSCLINDDGMIIAMSEYMGAVFGLPELTDHKYLFPVNAVVERPKVYNLLNNPDKEKLKDLISFFQGRERLGEVHIDDRKYIASQEFVVTTGWHFLTLVDEDLLLAEIRQFRTQTFRSGYFTIVLLVLFNILFYLYLRRRAAEVATRIARPVAALSESTSNMHQGRAEWTALPEAGIAELDTLSRNFDEMLSTLDRRTAALVQSELREKSRELEAAQLENLATTDGLTGINNRYKLNKALLDELKRCERNGSRLGVIMLDLDHFKKVNDTYGHLVGDAVLIEVAKRLMNGGRVTDTVGRWGGEEFLIICPEATQDGLILFAERFRQQIEDNAFSDAGWQTASFGATLSCPGNSVNDLITCADKALYLAKDNGRNRVEFIDCRKS